MSSQISISSQNSSHAQSLWWLHHAEALQAFTLDIGVHRTGQKSGAPKRSFMTQMMMERNGNMTDLTCWTCHPSLISIG